jgi:hypothetical protein
MKSNIQLPQKIIEKHREGLNISMLLILTLSLPLGELDDIKDFWESWRCFLKRNLYIYTVVSESLTGPANITFLVCSLFIDHH